MMTRGNWTGATAALILMALPWSGQALAQDAPDEAPWGYARWELWIGPVFWPALADLEPETGYFDDVGLGIGGRQVFVADSRFVGHDYFSGYIETTFKNAPKDEVAFEKTR